MDKQYVVMVGFTYPIVYTGISITIWISKANQPQGQWHDGHRGSLHRGFFNVAWKNRFVLLFVVVHWAKNIMFLWFNKDHRGIIMGYA